MASCALGEALAQAPNAHPPLIPVQLLVELLRIVAGQGRGSSGRRRGLAVVAGAAVLERGGDGAEDVEAQERRGERRAREGDPGAAPDVLEGFGLAGVGAVRRDRWFLRAEQWESWSACAAMAGLVSGLTVCIA